jgi:hypothetical protein
VSPSTITLRFFAKPTIGAAMSAMGEERQPLEAPSLKVVALECPYDNWSSDATQEAFGRMVGLKLQGYREEYPYGILPVDATDFVATHHMVCEEYTVDGPHGTTREMRPIMAYKSVRWARCRVHRLPFPLVAVAKACGQSELERTVRSILERCEATGKDVFYDSAWTMRPDVRKDPARKKLLHRIMRGIYVLAHRERVAAEEAELLCMATLRLRTDHLFEWWGYRRLMLGESVLPSFAMVPYFDERVAAFHLRDGFSREALDEAAACEQLWADRLHVGQEMGQDSGAAVNAAPSTIPDGALRGAPPSRRHSPTIRAV